MPCQVAVCVLGVCSTLVSGDVTPKRYLGFAQLWYSDSVARLEKAKMLFGTAKSPESHWDSLGAWNDASAWFSVRGCLLKSKTVPKLQKLKMCLELLEAQDEDTRDFVMEQIHPTVRMLLSLSLRMTNQAVPTSLSSHLLLELACLKYRGSSAMGELAEVAHCSLIKRLD